MSSPNKQWFWAGYEAALGDIFPPWQSEHKDLNDLMWTGWGFGALERMGKWAYVPPSRWNRFVAQLKKIIRTMRGVVNEHIKQTQSRSRGKEGNA